MIAQTNLNTFYFIINQPYMKYGILYQNENKINLDVTGIQVVFRIETALKYLLECWHLQDYTNVIISYKICNIQNKMHLTLSSPES